ncbi:hypothetical protein [Streptomyces sp. NPDC058548]|uniref:hypothetical protein n=1 Tax=Streptomyces sp. NPDC058548 TaxID=3346545 RepID=UPI003667F248
MADCVHRIDLCPECDGLRTVRLERLPGVSSIQLADDTSAIVARGPAAVYIGPVPGPCPNREEAAGRG